MKLILLLCYITSAISMVWFNLAVHPNNTIEIAFACGFTGLIMTANIPLTMEATVEVIDNKVLILTF